MMTDGDLIQEASRLDLVGVGDKGESLGLPALKNACKHRQQMTKCTGRAPQQSNTTVETKIRGMFSGLEAWI